MSAHRFRVAVVGGGISGLAAALHLVRAARGAGVALDLTLFESADRLGGKIRTIARDGFLIEAGPDSFAARDAPILRLIEGVGLGAELVHGAGGPTYVFTGHALHPMPSGVVLGVPTRIGPLLATPLLSRAGKLRALRGFCGRHPAPCGADESDADLLARRFGREFVLNVAAPLLEAIYADRMEDLSAAVTLRGALSPAARRRATAPRRHGVHREGPFASVRGGLESIVTAARHSLPAGSLRTRSAVVSVERRADGILLRVRDDAPIIIDAVVLATPADVAGRILGVPRAFGALQPRGSGSVVSVALAFRTGVPPAVGAGTGFVVDARAGCSISACTWVHQKWPHAVPAGSTLLRCSIVCAEADERACPDDDAVLTAVRRDLRRILGIATPPEFAVVTRWPAAMPRYAVGHAARLAALERQVAERFPGVFLAGASYRGASLGRCVAQGEAAAAAALSRAASAPPPGVPATPALSRAVEPSPEIEAC